MLWQVSGLKEFRIEVADERCGRVVDFLVDDRDWSARWIVVELGSWLSPHKVLVPPSAFGKPDEDAHRLPASWSLEGLIHGRDIDEDPPVSAQMAQRAVTAAAERLDALAAMTLVSGASVFPVMADDLPAPGSNAGKADPHLRSYSEVVGYSVAESNGALGRVQDFIIDDEVWTVTHLLIRWSYWWSAHDVVVPVSCINEVRWDDKAVALNLTTHDVRKATPIHAVAVHGRNIEPRPVSGWESVM